MINIIVNFMSIIINDVLMLILNKLYEEYYVTIWKVL